MSDKQPNALRLADELEQGGNYESQPCVVYGWADDYPTSEAAAELRRLHALCDEMGKALEATQAPLDLYNAYGWPDRAGVRRTVGDALAKWKESQ